MSIRWFNNNRGTFAVLGLLLGICMAAPACFAGGAATIVLDKHILAPRGSYIPERRVKEVLKKENEQKLMMEKKKSLQQEEQLQQKKLPEPQTPNEK